MISDNDIGNDNNNTETNICERNCGTNKTSISNCPYDYH